MIRQFLVGATASGVLLAIGAYAAEPMSPAAPGGAGPPAATAPSDANTAAATPAPPAAGPVSTVPAKGPPIVLENGKGTLIRLPRPANTVFIANPDIADVQIKSPLLIYLSAKSPGETVLYAVDADDRVMLNAPVRVEHDLSRVREGLSAIAPGENVTVSSVDNSLVLGGKVSSAARAEKVRSLAASIAGETKGTVVNRMSVATPNQVSIRVKVAEVNRSVLKSLGVNWSKPCAQSGCPGFGLPIHNLFTTTNPTAAGATLATGNFATIFGNTGWITQATISTLAQEGLVNLLAEPNLTAMNGQPASFLAGGEFPVPVSGAAATAGGIPTITVEFKKFGVSLDCTPTIIDAEHLNLRIRSEVSQLSTNGEVSVPLSATATVTIPALTVRRAETSVELGSGQSFILGGLLQNSDTQNVSKLPWLGDIPVLGQLFRSEQFQRNETELVIIVTPYLVNPTPTLARLATPLDGLTPAHDVEQFINGGLYRQKLPGPAKGPVGAGGNTLIGPAGFRLD